MKLKLLLFALMLSGGLLNAQDTIRTLMITEIRTTHQREDFVEITNMGDKAVHLGDFELGLIRCWNNVPWITENTDRSFMLPEKVLLPGQSYVLATACELNPKMFRAGSDDYVERLTKQEMWTLADNLTYLPEAIDAEDEPLDSVSGSYWWTWETQNGRGTYFLRHHLSAIDSVAVDQFGGVFDMENGLNNPEGHYDVAGVAGATGNSILLRKFNVKKGNLEFVRGVGLDDSEWIPVPIVGGAWRDVFWTLGNHGDYNLNANTLESSVIDVDFAAKKLTVPWGIRSNDDIMHNMVRKPGIAWEYQFSPAYEDSLYMSARTGDKMKIFVCGNDLDVATFDIIVKAPEANANIVIPKYNADPAGNWRDLIVEGEISWPRVTRNGSGIDTITGARFGLPYATRVDSLLKVLEKAPKAIWKIDWVDGIERADLKDGDILKVTAENGNTKNYYIQVRPHRPSHNSFLSAITWPDIPDEYRDYYGWVEDTIPGFNQGALNYKIEVPEDATGIPALIAKTADLNAKVEVMPAVSLTGSVEERTMKFIVTAEDGIEKQTYLIEFFKYKSPDDVQPYFAHPILSQFVFWLNWGASDIWEIANPGNQPLDLSKYMFVGGPVYSPADAILLSSEDTDWANRYQRYIPGYQWVSEADWGISPSMVKPDLNVNPFVLPGDVFVLGTLPGGAGPTASANMDIDFANNPWGESVGATCSNNWIDQNWFLFEILNDSITKGFKAANDLNDFRLIEVFGTGDGSSVNGWIDMQYGTVIKKPEFYEGKTGFKESLGPNGSWGTSDWIYKNQAYFNSVGNYDYFAAQADIGKHFMNEPTHYKSTITSSKYKVSGGYKDFQSVVGVKTGASVADFFSNIQKANEKQTLKVKSTANGSVLGMADLVSMNDTLVVLSADSVNITKYILDVTELGLNSDAVLTSTMYEIKVDGSEGTVAGVEYGTTLRTVLNNVMLPTGAIMQVFDDKGVYVSLQVLNFDTTYVDVTATNKMYIEVIAEDAITKISYRIMPAVTENDAFLTSDFYTVYQDQLLIDLVPRGTNVSNFLANLVPSYGATIKLVDKKGLERVDGYVADDDKVVVTSANKMYSNAYYISRLPEKYIQGTTYLAYILSETYQVDQVVYNVDGVDGHETISGFLSKVTPVEGATAMVIDKNNAEKTTGDIDRDDRVKVTSADGKIVVYYTFGQLTSAKFVSEKSITLYPNPTNSDINVSGVQAGYRIQVYNLLGVAVRDINVQSSIERISMSNQPAGMYMIVVSDNNRMIGRYKALKQ